MSIERTNNPPFKDLNELTRFTEKVLSYHIDKKSYTLVEIDGKLTLKSSAKKSPKVKIEDAEKLLDISLHATQVFGFKEEAVRKLSCCAYQAMKEVSKLPQVDSEKLKAATRNLMGVSCPIDASFEKLVMKNHLHYKLNRLGIHPTDPSIPSILVNGEWIATNTLTITKMGDEIHFKQKDKLLFKTYSDYSLKDSFFCGIQGIVEGDSTKGATIGIEKGTHPKEKGDGKYYVIIGTAVASIFSPQFAGDHSYMGLIDDKGNKTIFGQFGVLNDVSLKDLPTMCAHTEVGVESPDRYYGLPFTSYHTLETKHPLTKIQYEQIKSGALNDIQKGRLGSMMEDNCTGCVANILDKVVKVQSVMTPTAWVYRWLLPKILPRNVAASLINFGNKLPKWLTIPLHYLNPLYPVQILYGLIQSLTSFEKRRGLGNIKNIQYVLRALVCPWHFYVNHPLALREWQQRHKS